MFCSWWFSSGSLVTEMGVLEVLVWDTGMNLFHTFVESPLAQGLWVGQDAHAHIFGRIHQELLKYNQSQIVNLHCEREGWKQVAGAA